ncbi:MAG: non-canonical purine NTP pyrophosphatase, partial [Verrucomicrobiota bacterium]
EVDALGGAPGIFSARYAGPEASDADNREKLLRSMDGKTNRAASFCCVLALAEGDHIRSHFEGRSFGNILPEMRGDGGFGYDPLFVPSGHTQTFAELASTVKHQISHRGKAIEAFCETLHLT